MAVSTLTSRWAYTADGATTAFAFDNRIFETTDLTVYLDGVLQAAGYTVTGVAHEGGGFSSGNVTFAVAPANAVAVVIVRRVPNTQPVQFPQGGPFPSRSAERANDRGAIQTQQLADDLSRSMRKSDADASAFDPTLPLILAAGAMLQVNAGGTAFQAVQAVDLSLTTVTAFAATLLDDADATTARTTLGAEEASAKGADIASAGTVVIPTTGDYFDVTGTTAITGMTVSSGRRFTLQFDGALTLTHHATNLILPGSANITTLAGDVAVCRAVATDQVKVVAYTKADGTAVAGASGLPRSYLAGLQMSNDTDADHDISVAAGGCRDAADAANITLASAMVKRIDATWAAGTGNGGLSSSLSAPANNTVYHVFAIIVGGSADVGFDTSITAANLVADHSATAYRRIGSVITDGSANILGFLQDGDTFWLDTWIAELTNGTMANAGTTIGLTVPTGLRVTAIFNASVGTNSRSASFYPGDKTSAEPGYTTVPVGQVGVAGGEGQSQVYCLTDTSGQIIARGSDGASAAVTDGSISLLGWIDRRGRDD